MQLSDNGFMWRLHGDTIQDVECFIRPGAHPRTFVLTLVRNHETLLREAYPDQQGAVFRASELRDGLLTRGWTVVSA
jgi:hypothetical protein